MLGVVPVSELLFTVPSSAHYTYLSLNLPVPSSLRPAVRPLQITAESWFDGRACCQVKPSHFHLAVPLQSCTRAIEVSLRMQKVILLKLFTA